MMKSLSFICWIILIPVLFTACEPSTPTSVPSDVPVTAHPQEAQKVMLNLAPVVTMPEVTLVDFLIDNSTSVEQCGNLGIKRYDFVNFILRILRTIREPLSQNLYVGTSSFGNGADNYIPIIEPMVISPTFPLVVEPANTGDAQNFSEAIQLAADDMNIPGMMKKYLVIITDGKFSSDKDTVFSVQEKLKQVTADPSVSVLVGLICPEVSSSQTDIDLWHSRIEGINGAVDVFDGNEEMAQFLLEDLQPFLPHSLIRSQSNYRNYLSIAGYYISANFRYWNADTAKSTLNVTDISDGVSWDVSETQHTQSVRARDGCEEHRLSIPDPGDHWLLFIQAQTFQELALSMRSVSGEPIEVLNRNPIDLLLDVQDKSGDHDLRDWKDCFAVDLVDPGGEPLFVTHTHCDGVNDLCSDPIFDMVYGQLQWFPPPFSFPTRQAVTVRFSIKDADGPVWEGVLSEDIPVKFMAQYDVGRELPQITQKNLFFENVAFPAEVDIYLASRLSLPDLDNKNCPHPTQTLNSRPAILFKLSTEEACIEAPEPDESSICLSYSKQDLLAYQYTLQAPAHVTSTCQYDQLYFLFRESDAGTKAITWMCDLQSVKNICSKGIEKLDIQTLDGSER